MNFFSKLILYVTHDALTAGIWQFGRIKSTEKFSNNEDGAIRFKEFLQDLDDVNTYLLVDVIEEDYRQEILPHVTGRDRKNLLARKLDQSYRKLNFRAANFLNRDKENQRKDRFLFLAINQSEHIDAWLEIIEHQSTPLAGVYSLPMLSQFLLKKSSVKASQILLCEHLSSGFRQSYIEDEKMLVSRLSPYPAGASLQQKNTLLDFYLSEIEKSRFYLISQRLIKQQGELTLIISSAFHDARDLVEQIAANQNVAASILPLHQICKTLKIDSRSIEKNPELLYMHLLAKSNAKNLANLAPKRLLKNYYLNQIRRYSTLATALIFLGTLFLSALFFLDEQSRQKAIKELSEATNSQKIKYAQVAKNFPDTPYPSEQLLRAVNFYSEVNQHQQTPERAMQAISRAINKISDIQINRIEWLQTQDMNSRDAEVLAQNLAIQNQSNQPIFSKNQLHQVAYVTGEIKQFNGDYRGALTQANQMVDNLKKDVDVAHAELFQAPVNVSSYSNLEGSTTDEVDNKQMSAVFKIKVVLKQIEPKK